MATLPLQHRIELVTAPARQPITIAECKAQMRVEHSDDDLIINRFIDTAIAAVDVTGALGKAMITQTWGEWFAPNPGVIGLSLGPVQSVSAIKYYDSDNALQVATLSDFYVLGTKSRTTIKPKPGKSWPVVFNRDDAIKGRICDRIRRHAKRRPSDSPSRADDAGRSLLREQRDRADRHNFQNSPV